MSWWQTLRVALIALRRNKMRSALTALGVVIGVGAVIAMVAIGEGAKARVEESFASMGSNLLIVLPGSSKTGGMRGGFGSASTLTWDDLEAIRKEVPSVAAAAPQLRTNATAQSEEQNWSTSVIGTTPEFFTIRRWKVASGSLLQSSDHDARTKVAVVGQTVVNKLFGPSADPVGQAIRIRQVPFTIIGVLERKGQSPNGQDNDDAIYIPASTWQTKIQSGLLKYLSGALLVAATTQEATSRAEKDITQLLRDRHHITPPDEDDFFIRNLSELASAQQEGTKTLTALLASIALVSLLVGGIGVMNIMLVSVTERTREIGLRMALGAKSHHILLQFLIEALALSTLGGLIGVGLGLIAANRLAASFGWPMLIRPDIILLSVGFSGLVGIVFGLYPARRASQLNPIEALRFE